MDTLISCRPLAIDVARQLPALPAALLELLEMFGRDGIEIGTLAAKIALDPALAAKTLRLANSSFYGVSRHVGSLGEAAAELGSDAETAFTAGLLHDIGRLVLASGFPVRYAEVLAHGDARGLELGDCEQQLLGTDHTTVGALVAHRWCLPTPIVAAIGAHHGQRPAGAAPTLSDIVHLADLLVHAIEFGHESAEALPAACRQAGLDIGVPNAQLGPLFVEIDEQTRAICAALLD